MKQQSRAYNHAAVTVILAAALDQGAAKAGAKLTISDAMQQLAYDAKISVNYHRKRERFYRNLDASSKVVSLVALASIGFDAGAFTIGAALISAIFTIATVVVDCAGMAGLHRALAARFTGLMAAIASETQEDCDLERQFHIISADEPPQLRGLAQICQDEQDAALGDDVPMQRTSVWRLFKAHFGFGQMPIDWISPKANR